MSEELESERTYHEVSIKNDDGSTSKVLEFEVSGPIQLTPSDQKDSVTVSIPIRVETFGPIRLTQGISLILKREQVQKMAEDLGLIDTESSESIV